MSDLPELNEGSIADLEAKVKALESELKESDHNFSKFLDVFKNRESDYKKRIETLEENYGCLLDLIKKGTGALNKKISMIMLPVLQSIEALEGKMNSFVDATEKIEELYTFSPNKFLERVEALESDMNKGCDRLFDCEKAIEKLVEDVNQPWSDKPK